MKEATGELNITVITVIAIAAVAALFYAFIWPMVESSIRNNTCATFGENWRFVPGANGGDGQCCPPEGTTGTCVNAG